MTGEELWSLFGPDRGVAGDDVLLSIESWPSAKRPATL